MAASRLVAPLAALAASLAAGAPAAAVPFVPSVVLSNTAAPGVSMPFIGLGCGGYSSANAGYNAYPECWIGDGGATGGGSGTCGAFVQQAVTSWLQAGGRRLDAANSYQDQVDVGKAMNAFIASSGVPRADIFLLSKIGPSHPLGGADAKAQFEGILAEMQVDYVDLLLVHWPWDSASKGNVTNNATTSSVPLCNHTSPLFDERLCRLDTWRGMLDIFATGRARAVGVSNYNVSHFEEIVAAGMPLPALTQNPYHLYRSATQSDLIDWTARHGVTFLGYSPFGVPDYHNYSFVGSPAGNQLQHPYVLSLSDKYGATPAQVLIQWQYQLGIASNSVVAVRAPHERAAPPPPPLTLAAHPSPLPAAQPVNPRSMNATHMADNLATYALFSGNGLNQTEMDTLSSMPQDLCGSDASNWYECAA